MSAEATSKAFRSYTGLDKPKDEPKAETPKDEPKADKPAAKKTAAKKTAAKKKD